LVFLEVKKYFKTIDDKNNLYCYNQDRISDLIIDKGLITSGSFGNYFDI